MDKKHWLTNKYLITAVLFIGLLLIAFFLQPVEQIADINELPVASNEDDVEELPKTHNEAIEDQRITDNWENEGDQEIIDKQEITDKQEIIEKQTVENHEVTQKQDIIIKANNNIQPEMLTATLSVTCQTILNNMSKFNADKLEVLPEDGIIYQTQEVSFTEGETVFDVLLREMQKSRIHMEFEMTPIYNSHYIEGINNIYEFDCGELSGWRYRVNGMFVNYGSSQYYLKNGDVIEWIYTCDLGRDIGDG